VRRGAEECLLDRSREKTGSAKKTATGAEELVEAAALGEDATGEAALVLGEEALGEVMLGDRGRRGTRRWGSLEARYTRRGSGGERTRRGCRGVAAVRGGGGRHGAGGRERAVGCQLGSFVCSCGVAALAAGMRPAGISVFSCGLSALAACATPPALETVLV
jgi:hypothetical protein